MQDNRKFVKFIKYNKNFIDIKKNPTLDQKKSKIKILKQPAQLQSFKSILGQMITKEVFNHTRAQRKTIHKFTGREPLGLRSLTLYRTFVSIQYVEWFVN